jgi:hypothetical protein
MLCVEASELPGGHHAAAQRTDFGQQSLAREDWGPKFKYWTPMMLRSLASESP